MTIRSETMTELLTNGIRYLVMSMEAKKKKVVGFVTLGHAPRPDIVVEIKRAIGGKLEIVEVGALDGLSRNEILSLGSSSQDYRVVTRLSDGQAITIAKKHVLARMEAALRKLENQSVRFASILCTEEFPEYPFKGVLLKPAKLLFNFVSCLDLNGRGVIVIPLEEQKDKAAKRWSLPNADIRIRVLFPNSDHDAALRLIEELKQEIPEFVVLDCFGYDESLKREIQDQLSCPVILSRTLLGYALREIIGGGRKDG